jgi:hypothetical protein
VGGGGEIMMLSSPLDEIYENIMHMAACVLSIRGASRRSWLSRYLGISDTT